MGASSWVAVGGNSGVADPNNASPQETELWICGGGKWAARNILVGGANSSTDYSGRLVITNGIFGSGISSGKTAQSPVSILIHNVVNLYNGSLLVAGGSDPVALNVSNQFNVAHMAGGNFSAVFDGNASLQMLNSGGYISIGVGANSTGTLELRNGATASTKGNFTVCAGNDSTGTFKMSGGTLTVGKAVYLGGAGSEDSGRSNTNAKFIMTGGTATSTEHTEIGNFTGSTTGGYALLSLSGGARYTSKKHLFMGAANGKLVDQTWIAVTNATMTVNWHAYINGGNGGIALGNGAVFSVGGDHGITTAYGGRGYAGVGGDFTITIGAGSVLQTQFFKYDEASKGNNQNVAIAFEGGTLRAAVDAAQFIPKNDKLTVTVNSNGGIINTNGKSVTIPANITAAGGAASGDLKVTGSGIVTFTGSLAFGGAIDKSPETSLKLSVNSAASLFGADGGGLRLASDAAAGTVLFTYSEAPESEPDAAMLLAIKNGLSYADAAKEAATPARFAFKAVYDSTTMQVKLADDSVWVVGASGLPLDDSVVKRRSTWYATTGDATLKSTSDWVLAENPANIPPHDSAASDKTKASENATWKESEWVQGQTVASLTIADGATLTVDTSHYAPDGTTGAAGHVATFEGQVAGGADTAVAVAGDGTLYWEARPSKFSGTIKVASASTLRLAGCAYGFKWIAGFELDGTLVIDPIRKPVSVNATPVFGVGAKIRLDGEFDGTTLGKFVLMTWKESGAAATIPSGLLDASNLGAAGALSVETAPDGVSKQLVLRVGDYEANAKPIRILCIGDSITQGRGSSPACDAKSQYRTTIAAYLAARGYRPQMVGHWKLTTEDAAGVTQPEEWLWHSGVSGDAIRAGRRISGSTSYYSGGAQDNLHLYLDAAGYPDVITVLIGTNDCGIQNTIGETVGPWLTNFVTKVATERPGAKIVAGTIIDRAANSTTSSRTRVVSKTLRDAFNAGDMPPNVSLVDFCWEFKATLYEHIEPDGTHPQWNGHAKMAKMFADKIAEQLPFASFAPAADPTVTDEPQSPLGAANVAELAAWRSGFKHVYTIDFAATNAFFRNAANAPYTWKAPDVSAGSQIVKVGYYMELVRKGTNRRRWVWVDMDAAGKTLGDVDFPWDAETFRQEAVTKLHVKSNDFSIHEVAPSDDTVCGIVEATPFNYSANADGTFSAGGVAVKDVLDNTGWVDKHGTGGNKDGNGGFGSMQVHRVFTPGQKSAAGFWQDAETLFAWNRWGRNYSEQGDDVGIGPFFNHASGSRDNTADYTASADSNGSMYEKTGAAAYSVRRFEIWVVRRHGVMLLVR